jgi:hypothetical protein
MTNLKLYLSTSGDPRATSAQQGFELAVPETTGLRKLMVR